MKSLNVVGVDIPYLPLGMAERNIIDPKSPWMLMLHFISNSGRATLDDIYDKFNSAGVLFQLRALDLIKPDMCDGTYSLTKKGEDLIAIANWIAPVYELIDFMDHTDFSDISELDLLLTLAGNHELIEEKFMIRVMRVYTCGVYALGENVPLWITSVLRDIRHKMKLHEDVLRQLEFAGTRSSSSMA